MRKIAVVLLLVVSAVVGATMVAHNNTLPSYSPKAGEATAATNSQRQDGQAVDMATANLTLFSKAVEAIREDLERDVREKTAKGKCVWLNKNADKEASKYGEAKYTISVMFGDDCQSSDAGERKYYVSIDYVGAVALIDPERYVLIGSGQIDQNDPLIIRLAAEKNAHTWYAKSQGGECFDAGSPAEKLDEIKGSGGGGNIVENSNGSVSVNQFVGGGNYYIYTFFRSQQQCENLVLKEKRETDRYR